MVIKRRPKMAEALFRGSMIGLLVLFLAVSKAHGTCSVVKGKYDQLRLTCANSSTNFTKIYYSRSESSFFVGRTNEIMKLDGNLTILRQEVLNTNGETVKKSCLAACNNCSSNQQFWNSFCFNKNTKSCFPHLIPVCENSVVAVQPVYDSNNNEYLVTCGTASGDTNQANCQVRSVTDLSPKFSFRAVLNQRPDLPNGFISLPRTPVNSSGAIIVPYFTVGVRPGVADVYDNGSFIRSAFPLELTKIDRFRNSHHIFLQRKDVEQPMRDVSLYWHRQVNRFNEFANVPDNIVTTVHLQYLFEGHVYIFASGVGITEEGKISAGSFVWRYCQNDKENVDSLASLRRAPIACTGEADLRDFTRLRGNERTSKWKMNQMTSAIEVNDEFDPFPITGSAKRNFVLAAFVTLQGLPGGSSICSFEKGEIKKAFDNNPGRNFALKRSDKNAYYQFPSFSKTSRTCYSVPVPDDFIRNYTNMDYLIEGNHFFPYTMQSNPLARFPLFYIEGNDFQIHKLAYTTIRSRTYQHGYIFAEIGRGRVLRLAARFPTSNSDVRFNLVNQLQFGEFDLVADLKVSDMEIARTEKSNTRDSQYLVVSTQRSITREPVTNCRSLSKDCRGCSSDPLCQFCGEAGCSAESVCPAGSISRHTVQTCPKVSPSVPQAAPSVHSVVNQCSSVRGSYILSISDAKVNNPLLLETSCIKAGYKLADGTMKDCLLNSGQYISQTYGPVMKRGGKYYLTYMNGELVDLSIKSATDNQLSQLCAGLYCPKPTVGNGVVTQLGRLRDGLSSKYQVQCYDGYHLSNVSYNPSCTVAPNGNETTFLEVPTCIRINFCTLPKIARGTVRGAGRVFNYTSSHYTVECNQGSALSNTQYSRECNRDRNGKTYFPNIPECFEMLRNSDTTRCPADLYLFIAGLPSSIQPRVVEKRCNDAGATLPTDLSMDCLFDVVKRLTTTTEFRNSNLWSNMSGPIVYRWGRYYVMNQQGHQRRIALAIKYQLTSICAVAFCKPPTVQNGRIITVGRIYKGKISQYSVVCNPGYTSSLPTPPRCTVMPKTKIVAFPTIPTCDPVALCAKPDVKFGVVTQLGLIIGGKSSRYHVSCTKGFVLSKYSYDQHCKSTNLSGNVATWFENVPDCVNPVNSCKENQEYATFPDFTKRCVETSHQVINDVWLFAYPSTTNPTFCFNNHINFLTWYDYVKFGSNNHFINQLNWFRFYYRVGQSEGDRTIESYTKSGGVVTKGYKSLVLCFDRCKPANNIKVVYSNRSYECNSGYLPSWGNDKAKCRKGKWEGSCVPCSATGNPRLQHFIDSNSYGCTRTLVNNHPSGMHSRLFCERGIAVNDNCECEGSFILYPDGVRRCADRYYHYNEDHWLLVHPKNTDIGICTKNNQKPIPDWLVKDGYDQRLQKLDWGTFYVQNGGNITINGVEPRSPFVVCSATCRLSNKIKKVYGSGHYECEDGYAPSPSNDIAVCINEEWHGHCSECTGDTTSFKMPNGETRCVQRYLYESQSNYWLTAYPGSDPKSCHNNHENLIHHSDLEKPIFKAFFQHFKWNKFYVRQTEDRKDKRFRTYCKSGNCLERNALAICFGRCHLANHMKMAYENGTFTCNQGYAESRFHERQVCRGTQWQGNCVAQPVNSTVASFPELISYGRNSADARSARRFCQKHQADLISRIEFTINPAFFKSLRSSAYYYRTNDNPNSDAARGAYIFSDRSYDQNRKGLTVCTTNNYN